MNETRKNVALRVPPNFAAEYEVFELAIKEEHGFEAKRCFTDALLEQFLIIEPIMMVAVDIRAPQVRTMISPGIFEKVIDYLNNAEHRVPFSVFSYNALHYFFEDGDFRKAVEARMVLNLYQPTSSRSSNVDINRSRKSK